MNMVQEDNDGSGEEDIIINAYPTICCRKGTPEMYYYFKYHEWPHVIVYIKVLVTPNNDPEWTDTKGNRPPEDIQIVKAISVNDVSGIMYDYTENIMTLNNMGTPSSSIEFHAVEKQFINYQKGI